jgi:hypothetical protein
MRTRAKDNPRSRILGGAVVRPMAPLSLSLSLSPPLCPPLVSSLSLSLSLSLPCFVSLCLSARLSLSLSLLLSTSSPSAPCVLLFRLLCLPASLFPGFGFLLSFLVVVSFWCLPLFFVSVFLWLLCSFFVLASPFCLSSSRLVLALRHPDLLDAGPVTCSLSHIGFPNTFSTIAYNMHDTGMDRTHL